MVLVTLVFWLRLRLDGQQTLPGLWSNEHTVCQELEQLVCLMFGMLARLMSAVVHCEG